MVVSIVIAVIVCIVASFYFFRRGQRKSKEEVDFLQSQIDLVGKLYDRLQTQNGDKTAALFKAENERESLASENIALKNQINGLVERCKRIENQKKSSEVRTGKIAEKMAPFLDGWPYPVKNCYFLGNPIDFVAFLEDEVCFIEVKSGKSRLTSSQKNIRDLIKDGKVKFEVYRVEGDG